MVDVVQWRVHVDLWHRRRSGCRCRSVSKFPDTKKNVVDNQIADSRFLSDCDTSLLSLVLIYVIQLLLFLSGDVETNPGPMEHVIQSKSCFVRHL